MRGLALALALVAGCTQAAVPAPGSPSARPAAAGPTATPVTPEPTRAPSATPAAVSDGAAAVAYHRADLAGGAREGVTLDGGTLVLGGTGLVTGRYVDPHGLPARPNLAAVPFESGSWTGAWTATPFPFDELIPSWTAATPAGTWIRVEAQARGAGRETKWYTLAVWASGDVDIRRTTVRGQDDADARVSFDTLVRARSAAGFDAHRLRATLYRRTGTAATPRVSAASAMVSAAAQHRIPSAWTGAAVDLAVPLLSQETHTGHSPEYDGGGEAWCSPTSTAMVLRFWGTGPAAADLAAFPGAAHADGEVDHAARATYDWAYSGAGNWPFNTAHAATYGLDGFVTRLRSLVEAQRFLEAGIPLIASINGVLPGFLLGKTNGHLLVVRGLTPGGDVITNDPAVLSNGLARKVYARADFERVWLEGSGGVVYVIRPARVALPANVPGLPANW